MTAILPLVSDIDLTVSPAPKLTASTSKALIAVVICVAAVELSLPFVSTVKPFPTITPPRVVVVAAFNLTFGLVAVPVIETPLPSAAILATPISSPWIIDHLGVSLSSQIIKSPTCTFTTAPV